MSDFGEYPMKEALIKAFKVSPMVFLKLPRNMDLEDMYQSVAECYCIAKLNEKQDQLFIQTMMINEKNQRFPRK